MRYSEILVENRDYFIHPAFNAPVRGCAGGIKYCHIFVAAKTRMVCLPEGEKSLVIC